MSTSLLSSTLSDDTTDQISVFRKIANEISELGQQVNIKITPFHNPDLIYFSKLDSLRRQKVLRSLEIYLDIYKSTIMEGSSVLDSSRVVWNTLIKLGYKPTSDLFAHIQDGNIIEIHDNQFVQVFRNLNFFNYCSYSLEELYCNQITDLYERDLKLENDMMSIVMKIYSGQITSTILTHLEPHVIQEKISTLKLRVMGNIKYISPLYSIDTINDLPKATIAIETAELSDANIIHKLDFIDSENINNVIPLTF